MPVAVSARAIRDRMPVTGILNIRRTQSRCGQTIPEQTMTSIAQIFLFVLDIVWWVLIVHIIMSWLINFQVLNTRQPLVAQIWYGINKLLEPIYRPLRRIIPPMGGLDITPIVVFIGIYALRVLIINNLYY